MTAMRDVTHPHQWITLRSSAEGWDTRRVCASCEQFETRRELGGPWVPDGDVEDRWWQVQYETGGTWEDLYWGRCSSPGEAAGVLERFVDQAREDGMDDTRHRVVYVTQVVSADPR